MSIVVIGSGINGLVAAAELALAGREVVLLERSERIGGFIESAQRTLPGFVHDVYSSWHPLFVSSAAYAVLGDELHARGLEYVNATDAVTASTADVGGRRRTVIAHRDPGVTATSFESDADGAAYLRMLDLLGTRSPVVFGALGGELGSRRVLAGLGWKGVRTLRIGGLEALMRDALTSGRGFLRRSFRGWEVDALWTPWLLHSGLGPDHALGGAMIPVFAGAIHQFGLPVVTGGAGNFVTAFERLLRDAGVDIRTGVAAEQIVVRGGRTAGVRTSSGTIAAEAVLASVSPRALYDGLLGSAPGVADRRAAAALYRPGRAAAQLHLALDGPVPWDDGRLASVPLVHLSDGSGSTGVAVAQAEARLLPASPTVVVGQQSVLDDSRAPAGKATLWLQLQEVPFEPAGDAGGIIDVQGGWDDATVRERFVDRVLERLEHFAPGLRSIVSASDLLAPTDLARVNPNAVDGDPYAGAAELDQNLMWRPFPGARGHTAGVPGVWHIGAATHPGPGLGAGSGHLVAQHLLKSSIGRSRIAR